MKNNRETNASRVALVVLMACLALLWFYHLKDKYMAGTADVARDYLVARHIVKYKEYPTIGPWNSVYASLRNSPVYYYVLSFFVSIRDDMMFLGLVNVVLQLAVVFFVYMIANELFGPPTAIIGASLYGLSTHAQELATFMWQPQVMLPFLSAGYWFVSRGYNKNCPPCILAGSALLGFSVVLHFSAVTILPLALPIIWLGVYGNNRAVFWRAASYGVMFGIIVGFYRAEFVRLVAQHRSLFAFQEPVYAPAGSVLRNFVVNFGSFLNEMVFGFARGPSWRSVAASAIVILITVVYFLGTKNRKARIRLLWLAIFLLQPIVFSSVLAVRVYNHYFSPSYALMVIFIAEALRGAVVQFGSGALYAVVTVVILVFSGFFSYVRWPRADNNFVAVQRAAKSIVQSTESADNRGAGLRYDNYVIHFYQKTRGKVPSEAILWAQVEALTGKKLVTAVDYDNNFATDNSDQFVFLVCDGYGKNDNGDEECIGEFKHDSPNYRLVKQVFEGLYDIFLFQREKEYIIEGKTEI